MNVNSDNLNKTKIYPELGSYWFSHNDSTECKVIGLHLEDDLPYVDIQIFRTNYISYSVHNDKIPLKKFYKFYKREQYSGMPVTNYEHFIEILEENRYQGLSDDFIRAWDKLSDDRKKKIEKFLNSETIADFSLYEFVMRLCDNGLI